MSNTFALPAEAAQFNQRPEVTDPIITELGAAAFNAYALSTDGLHQAAQPLRYVSGFGSYGRGLMLQDFGSSAHPLMHMPATAAAYLRVLDGSVTSSEYSPSDVAMGHAAAINHDIGECTHPSLIVARGAVVGDIPFGQKTDKHRDVEAAIRQEMYARHHQAHMTDRELDRMERLIAHREGSPIQDALEAAHDTSSYIDGVRAGVLALNTESHAAGGLFRHLQLIHMATIITSTTLGLIETHSNAFPVVERILDQSAPLLKTIQETFGTAT